MDITEPDSDGLWSVSIPIELCRGNNSFDLLKLFEKAGVVKRMIYGTCCVFIQYGSKDEAFRAKEIFQKEKNISIQNGTNDKQKKGEKSILDNAVNTKQKDSPPPHQADCPDSHEAGHSQEGDLVPRMPVLQMDICAEAARINKHPTSARLQHHSQAMINMPICRTLFTDMPPLIPVEAAGNTHEPNCSIFVANFPAFSTNNALRKAFSKYHVLDICVLNSGGGQGRTKAFLYLATIYEAISAVIEMDGSCILGPQLKVDVPFTNVILKALVKNVMSTKNGIKL